MPHIRCAGYSVRPWYVNHLNNRSRANGNNHLDNNNGRLVGIAKPHWNTFLLMTKTTFERVHAFENLLRASEKARKGKTLKPYVIEFEKDLEVNLRQLGKELEERTYRPKPLKTFVIRDPKTRTISKSDYRDRIIHHALCNVIEPMFDKTFIHDSHANRKGKGTLKAIKRFEAFHRKASKNNTRPCYVLKADIRPYFDTVNHEILLGLLKKRIEDADILALIRSILENHKTDRSGQGMPLGNLTSQFFANVYLNELDQFVKHHLKAKYYIRYVDDFAILSTSKKELNEQKTHVNTVLEDFLRLELHPNKCKIIETTKGVNFLGFRIFPTHKLLRKKNVWKFEKKLSAIQEAYNEKSRERERERESTPLQFSKDGWRMPTTRIRTSIVDT